MDSHDCQIIVIVPDNEWRDRNGREELGLFTFEEALAFLANADNLQSLTEEECRKLMLIIADGRARFKVLLREHEENGKTFEFYFRFYKARKLFLPVRSARSLLTLFGELNSRSLRPSSAL